MQSTRPFRMRAVTAQKTGGVLILEAYNPAQLASDTRGPRDVTMLMRLATRENERASLTFESGREVERDIQDGHLPRR